MHFTALDKAVGVVTATYVVAELGSQFAHANSTQRVILVLLAPVYLSFFLLPHFLLRDRWARFRAPFALSLKAAVLLCSVDGVRLVHMQVGAAWLMFIIVGSMSKLLSTYRLHLLAAD